MTVDVLEDPDSQMLWINLLPRDQRKRRAQRRPEVREISVTAVAKSQAEQQIFPRPGHTHVVGSLKYNSSELGVLVSTSSTQPRMRRKRHRLKGVRLLNIRLLYCDGCRRRYKRQQKRRQYERQVGRPVEHLRPRRLQKKKRRQGRERRRQRQSSRGWRKSENIN